VGCPKTSPLRCLQIADSTGVRFAGIGAHKQMSLLKNSVQAQIFLLAETIPFCVSERYRREAIDDGPTTSDTFTVLLLSP
jgi:hypothetical protein